MKHNEVAGYVSHLYDERPRQPQTMRNLWWWAWVAGFCSGVTATVIVVVFWVLP